MRKPILVNALIFLQLFFIGNIYAQIEPIWYIGGGYNFSHSRMKAINDFIDAYNMDPNKRGGYIMDSPMPHIHQLKGINLIGGLKFDDAFLELSYTKKYALTLAEYSNLLYHARYIEYQSKTYGVGGYKLLVNTDIFDIYYGASLDFVKSKSRTWLTRTNVETPIQDNLKLGFTPGIQIFITPVRVVPIKFSVRPYWQMMLSKTNFWQIHEAFQGDYIKYFESDQDLKSSCGNIGVTLNAMIDLAQLFDMVPKREKPVKPVVEELASTVNVFGNVTDAKTGKPVNAQLTIINPQTNKEVAVIQTDYGYYRISLPRDINYTVKIEGVGYETKQDNINLIGSKTNEQRQDFSINAIKVGDVVRLNNIYFEKGKSVLLPESFKELDNLYLFLKDNPTIEIEIAGHTSSEGEYSMNMKLSEDRAKAVENYITGKGIEKNRITSKGYGPNKPVADNDTEAGRKMNRRVEFKILKN